MAHADDEGESGEGIQVRRVLGTAIQPRARDDPDHVRGSRGLGDPAHLVQELLLDALGLHEDCRAAALDTRRRQLVHREAACQRTAQPLVVKPGRIPEVQMRIEHAHVHILPHASSSTLRRAPGGRADVR